MATQLLNLPVNVPWKLVGVSQDMMDVRFCDKRFPFEWRSSLALSVFEPRAEDLPGDLCDGFVTFLKVTCTITGYQPTREETERGYVEFPDIPTERLDSILRGYFACYGALLNVAVFPFPGTRRELHPVAHSFEGQHPSENLPNPLDLEGVSYEAAGEASNRIADVNPTAGGRIRALDLRNEMTVTLSAATPRVEAKVSSLAAPITMQAFEGQQLVGSATTGARGQVETLASQAEAIDRLVFTTTEDKAFLVELTTDVAEDVPIDVKDFPHIIDFEPKTRDLYQAATETGELLTASVSAVRTDKSFTHTESSETGVSLSGTVGFAAGQGGGPFGSITGGLTRRWGETTQDQFNVQTDASRERRESNATTTNLNQLYNLLRGYHPGTNRAVFLQLPRPHVLQPTDHRTFVQGLREIEGVQDFFLIVARPEGIEGLSVEAFLETSHFPEGMQVQEPQVEYDERHEDFILTAESRDDGARSIEEFSTSKYTIESGWIIDRRESRIGQLGNPHIDGWDAGHPGIKDLDSGVIDRGAADLAADGTLAFSGTDIVTRYNYQPISDGTVQVSGSVLQPTIGPDVRHFRRNFRVFTRSERPKPTDAQPRVSLDRLLITARQLCVCFRSGDCPEVLLCATPPPPPTVSIVEERRIEIDPALLTPDETAPTRVTTARLVARDGAGTPEARGIDVVPTLTDQPPPSFSRLPAMKALLVAVQSVLTGSGRSATRLPYGAAGFLDSDFFKDGVRAELPSAVLNLPLAQVANLPPEVVEGFGPQTRIGDALEPDLASFARTTGLAVEAAAQARFLLLTARVPGPE
jgi:hypothetical protein